ncbi:MAG: CotH kinase family protein [Flavobacteriia bacterium]|nr:CotH kinase family protein [Flavobacteriia bacterium]
MNKFILFLYIVLGINTYTAQLNFTDSNLPIVLINTPLGQDIVDEYRIVCDMGVIDNGFGNRNYITDVFNNYNGKIAIEIRGSTSQQYPKKGYGFETQDAFGLNNNVELLGLPSENDWILNGPYPDKTLLRDVLTFDLSQKMGHYASNWKFCELMINNQYLGVYILMERIKKDNDRVDISNLDEDDLEGDSLTGGYIVKVDKLTGENTGSWTSNYNAEVVFQVHDPEFDELNPIQFNYIKNYLNSFEDNLNSLEFDDPINGYSSFIETESFYDFFILQELGRTVDGYRSSAFLHKDKIGGKFDGKLVAGPMWDFNLSYGNADYCDAMLTTGWQYNFDEICDFTSSIPFWWEKLLASSKYRNGLKCRWLELRNGVLHTDSLHHFIDSMANYLEEARIRNFIQWPIIGVYVNWNAFVGNSYEEDLNYFKNYITQRALWIDNNLAGTCDASIFENSSEKTDLIFPNPIENQFQLQNYQNYSSINIIDLNGKTVFKQNLDKTNGNIKIELPNGVYYVELIKENYAIPLQKIIVLKP